MTRALAPGLLCVMACGCGYVGEPLPPLLNIPVRVTDLSAAERGAQVIVQFTLPRLTTEGMVIKQALAWDVRAGEAGGAVADTERWAAGANSLGAAPEKNGYVRYEIPAAPWVGKEVAFAARVRSANGRASQWSNVAVLAVIAPLAKPVDVKAAPAAEGVELSWTGAAPGYRISRRAGDEKDYTNAGDTESSRWIDRNTEYGKQYRYRIRAIARTGGAEVESDPSEEASITPADIFPPAVPTGLAAVPTTDSIELAWERDTEPDLAGYRIYRATLPGGGFEKIGETGEAPSYSDHKVESGKRYRYAVSAFDKTGNESKLSEAVESAVP